MCHFVEYLHYAILLAVQDYVDCSCIGDVRTNTSDVSSSAVQGVCEVTSCYTWRLVVFFLVLFIAMFLAFVSQIFHVSSLLRCHLLQMF